MRAGSKINKGQSVDITISKGKKEKKVSVPDVTGLPLEAAKEAITSAGFHVGSVSKEPSKQAEGTVVSQSPAGGSSIAEGTAVNLVVAEASVDKGKKDSDKKNNKQENGAPAVQRSTEGTKSR